MISLLLNQLRKDNLMQNIFEAIKKYPMEFMDSASHRSCTTPSEINRRNHIKLQQAIQTENWEQVKELIKDPSYYSPLRGVVFCLSRSADLTMQDHHTICELMDQNQII